MLRNAGWCRGWVSVRAAMFYEPGDVRMEDVPEPEPGPGEILVRIGAALTCGTDVKTFKRGHPTLIKEVPSPFGHEFGGPSRRSAKGSKIGGPACGWWQQIRLRATVATTARSGTSRCARTSPS